MQKSTQFKKGVSGNPNGRTKGTPNKVTTEVRETFKDLLEDNLPKIQEDIDSLKPMERLTVLMQMAKFVLPTLKAIDLRGRGNVVIDFREYNIPREDGKGTIQSHHELDDICNR